MKTVIAAIAMMALVGCAPTYYNDNASPEQVRMDTAYCQMVAIQAGGLPMDMASAGISGIQRARAFEYCAVSKGYVRK